MILKLNGHLNWMVGWLAVRERKSKQNPVKYSFLPLRLCSGQPTNGTDKACQTMFVNKYIITMRYISTFKRHFTTALLRLQTTSMLKFTLIK